MKLMVPRWLPRLFTVSAAVALVCALFEFYDGHITSAVWALAAFGWNMAYRRLRLADEARLARLWQSAIADAQEMGIYDE